MAKGINFIETKAYSAEDDARILKLYEGLRVADVSDGSARDTDEIAIQKVPLYL